MKQKKQKNICQLKVDDIVELGGNEGDLQLLADVDDGEEEMEIGENDATNTEGSEIGNFVKELGFEMKPKKKMGKKQPHCEAKKPVDEDIPMDKCKEGKVIIHSRKQKNKYKVEQVNSQHVVKKKLKSTHLRFEDEQYTHNNLLVKPGHKWFEHNLVPDQLVSTPQDFKNENELKGEAEALLKKDVELYKKFQHKRSEKSDFGWIQTVLRSGTVSDIIAAHTLLIQDSAVHNLMSIDALIAMVNTKGKRECLMAMDCLRDLFLSDLLLEDKKLKPFNQHPLHKLDDLASGNLETRSRRLLLWYFEDLLKQHYTIFLKALESVSHDTVEKMKRKAVTVICELLRYNPEQEQFLLEHLVNKIGDPAHQIGAHVCHLLGQLVNYHPNMKSVVIQEVERLLFRPNIPEKTQYYCLCFLNQLILSHDDAKTANCLIIIYFGQFKACVKTGEVDSKMMSALLTGVSRAYPFANLENNVILEQLDTMYHIVHMVNFNISVQALMLIFQVLDSKDSVSDRFYSALYRKLVDPAISNSSRQAVLLNLVYRALKKDISEKRVKAFVKRLIQICQYQAPPLACGILFLISELAKTHEDLLESKSFNFDCDDNEDEHFEDVPNENDEETELLCVESNQDDHQKCSSWIHRQNQQGFGKSKTNYDPYQRNPLHAGAEYCNLWELGFMKKNFHPSVSLFAHQLCNGQLIKYSGDPLQDFTITRFLERFVYRNPKKLTESPSADEHRKVFGGRQLYKFTGSQQLSITSEAYILQNEDKVPVEEKFIYHYLCQQAAQGKKKKGDSDIESVTSEDFEKLLNEIRPEDESKEFPDFSMELAIHNKKALGKKKQNQESDEEDEFEISDEEPDFESDEEFNKAFKDFDEDIEAVTEEDGMIEPWDNSESIKMSKSRTKKFKSFDTESLFASADQFAKLLDENVGSKVDTITTEALANKDNADAKQILWETQRERWIHGGNWRKRGQKRKNKHSKAKAK